MSHVTRTLLIFRSGSEHADQATWHGSGAHIPNVMNDYPQSEWCTCTPRHEWRPPGAMAVGTEGKAAFEYPPPGERADGWFKRCVGFTVLYLLEGEEGGYCVVIGSRMRIRDIDTHDLCLL